MFSKLSNWISKQLDWIYFFRNTPQYSFAEKIRLRRIMIKVDSRQDLTQAETKQLREFEKTTLGIDDDDD